MATRSRIGVKQPDGRIKSVYCHWDGSPTTRLPILRQFDTYEKAMEIVKLGSISSLEPKLMPDGEHTFDKAEKGCTVAYHRDRGERLEIAEDVNETHFYARHLSGEEYLYLFKDGDWWYRPVGNRCDWVRQVMA